MKIEVRCTSVRIVPSDASGFLLDAEVADRTEILRQAILEMTEAEIDNAFGKENTDRAAEHTRRLIDWTVERVALSTRIAALEEALRPFAEVGRYYNPAAPDDKSPSPSIFVGQPPEIRVGHFRRASKVLKEKP